MGGKYSAIPLIAILLLIFAPITRGQISVAIGGVGNDEGVSIVETNNGYVVVGFSESFGAGSKDILITAFSDDLAVLWSKSFGGEEEDVPRAAISNTSGDMLILGNTYSFGAGDMDIYLIKVDADGNHLWSKTYGGNMEERGFSIVECVDGGYILGGSTQSAGFGLRDALLIRVNAQGEVIWSKVLGIGGHQNCFNVQQTNDGGFVFTGTKTGFDIQLTKLDANGNVEWNKIVNLTSQDHSRMVKQTLDGGYLCVGHVAAEPLNYDIFLLKLNAMAGFEWAKVYGKEGQSEAACGLFIMNAGEILVSAFSNNFYNPTVNTEDSDLLILRLDEKGNVITSFKYGGESNELFYFGADASFAFSSPDKIALIGTTSYGYVGERDMLLVLTNLNANENCIRDTIAMPVTEVSPYVTSVAYPSTTLTLYEIAQTLEENQNVTKWNICCNNFDVSILGDTTFCEGETTILEVDDNYEKYDWNNGQTIHEITVFEEGQYCVTVTDEWNCMGSECLAVTYKLPGDCRPEDTNPEFTLLLPTAFSPNNDGINDNYGAISSKIPDYFRLQVFNRWGQGVFKTSSHSDFWNGQYRGREAPTGTYVYWLEARFGEDAIVKKGNLTLIR